MSPSRFLPLLAIALTLLCVRPPGASAASSGDSSHLEGHWQGKWTREGSSLDVWVDFTRSDSGYAGSFGSDALRALDIPFRSVQIDASGVHWVLVGDATTSTFDGRIDRGELSGVFKDGEAPGTFRLRRTVESTAPPYTSEEIHFTNGTVTLAGTLMVPQGSARHPAIVFVHGSGAEGRYASRYLADRFARAGFAALIYDKRGVGESEGDWKRAGFEALAGDAVAAIRKLAGDHRIQVGGIGLFGHSQGGTIAPLIASQSKDLGFVIASAGSGVPLMDGERYSYSNYLGLSHLHGADSLRAAGYVDAIVRTAYQGGAWESADSAAKANENAKWLMPIPARDHPFWWLARRTADYDPPSYWRHVKVPVLLIYGEKDERVPVEPSLRRIRAALSEGGNADVTAKIFAACDHTFRITESDDGRFHWPRTPPDYLDTLIPWARTKAQAR
jgi:pimeloyl-ACP methyl ester carboxylesterase